MYCCERLNGTVDWHYMTYLYILGQPSIGDSRVYITDEIGNIYAFEDALKIQNISGGLLGVKAQIQNNDDISLSNIIWSISVDGGYLGLINRNRFSTIQELQAGHSKTIRLIPIFGIGTIEIVVTATIPYTNTMKKVKQGFILGSVCLIQP